MTPSFPRGRWNCRFERAAEAEARLILVVRGFPSLRKKQGRGEGGAHGLGGYEKIATVPERCLRRRGRTLPSDFARRRTASGLSTFGFEHDQGYGHAAACALDGVDGCGPVDLAGTHENTDAALDQFGVLHMHVDHQVLVHIAQPGHGAGGDHVQDHLLGAAGLHARGTGDDLGPTSATMVMSAAAAMGASWLQVTAAVCAPRARA